MAILWIYGLQNFIKTFAQVLQTEAWGFLNRVSIDTMKGSEGQQKPFKNWFAFVWVCEQKISIDFEFQIFRNSK